MADQKIQKIGAHDHLVLYCRVLGHNVPFNYCRKMNSNLPCSQVLNCWRNILSIDEFIHEFYTEDDVAFFLQSTKPKLVQIYEEMMKTRNEGKKSSFKE